MKYELIKNDYKNLSLVETILTNRGFELEDIEHYLNTTSSDVIPPEHLTNIKEGVTLLIKHIAANDKIFLQIDGDCDGITSSAFFLNYLWKLFPSFTQNNIIYSFHFGKEHGLILEEIPENVQMVIAIDSASFDYEIHHALKEKNIDVLVIDHHDAPYYSLDACVINNQLDDKYHNKTLSGVGMAYKFCSYIDKIMNTHYAEEGLDLVALGMIADMISLQNFETKYLIDKGLSNPLNPFFVKLFEKNSFSMKDKLTPTSVAFYMAPYVNGMVRSGTQDQKMLLFDSMLEYKAKTEIASTKRGHKGEMEELVEQSVRTCTNVKKKQDEGRDEGLEKLKKIVDERNLCENKVIVILLDENNKIEANLGGLVANQLMSHYKQPVCVLRDTGEMWEGSCRAPRILDFKDLYETSELLDHAAGHQHAFGIGIKKDKIQDFIDYTNKVLADVDFSTNYQVDFIYQSNTLSGQDILQVADLDTVWGQTIEEPMIAVENIKLNKNNVNIMGKNKNTLKIMLPNNISLIKFNCSQEELEQFQINNMGVSTINIVGTCAANEWLGESTPQIMIKDYEFQKKYEYYF